MKTKIYKIVACTLSIVLTIALLSLATDITENKMSDYKFNDFFNEKNDYDVLFFGSSHIVNGIYPMDLWNDYGIVSYNMAGHGTQIPTTYWILKNSLDYTNPKLVVIDGYLLSNNYKTSEQYKYLHFSFDAFPLSINKIKAIFDLTDDPVIKDLMNRGLIKNEPRTKLELMWDFSIYHSRWEELMEEDFTNPSSPTKGADINKGNYRYVNNYVNDGKIINESTVAMNYMQKMIDLCKSKGIEVLLTYLPVSSQEEICYRESNTLKLMAKNNNVNFISYLDNDLIDGLTDFADKDSHLNQSGASKITKSIGEYIISTYNINNRKKDDNFQKWNIDYQNYLKFINK